ncbi:MAG: hypothetical protein ABW252_11035 [Polyangiales bacterium]
MADDESSPVQSDAPEHEEAARPAAQLFGGTVIGAADASASVASAETKALFEPGQCDDVYEFRFFSPEGADKPYLVQPGGEYQPTVQFDAPWGDEKVQAVAFKPLIDNKKVTHHYILMAGSMGWLDAWAPGNEDPALPPDVGMELPRGPRALGLNMHYYNLTGTTAEPDRSGIAICVVRGAHLRPKTAAVHMGFAGVGAPMVPPNVKGHNLVGTCKAQVKEPVTLYSFFPHMHVLGRHMKFTVTKPDGRVITLHDETFSFIDQAAFPVPNGGYVVENGDTFTTTCTYDNETNKNIALGENTDNEMCFVITGYYPKGALNCGFLGIISNGQLPPGLTPRIPGATPAVPAPAKN